MNQSTKPTIGTTTTEGFKKIVEAISEEFADNCGMVHVMEEDLATFIMQLLAQEKKTLLANLKIGDLRQWLNEDRITDADKFVANYEIEYMLGLAHSQVVDTKPQRSEDREGKEG